MTNTHDGETRTPEQVAELFAIAGREVQAIENRMTIDLKGQPLNVQQGNEHSNAAIDRA